MEYYQLGGFNPATKHRQHSLGKDSLRRCFADGIIELVLGIKPSGSSHLLLTWQERRRLTIPDLRLRASDFESLSPILFHGCEELERKLDWLQPGRQSGDSSRGNKQYHHGNYGAERGQFENIRVFYRVLQKQIDKSKYDLGDASWASSIRVFSFTYNLWFADTRGPDDRRNFPKVLDMGWSEARTPALSGEQKTCRHIVIKDNQNLQNPEKTNYQYSDYGPTQTCAAPAAAEKARDFFGKYSHPTRDPVVLVVHDWEKAKNLLEFLGVDVSRWKWNTGLKDLVRPGHIQPRRQAPHDPRPQPRDWRRSASPHQHDRSRRESPPPSRYAPVYVVDIQAMFCQVFLTDYMSKSVPDICRRLRLFNEKGWCAGNECWCDPYICYFVFIR
ncbi:hypothetical protein DFH07DRAFT_50688 [Mycena maculata]|uniref:Uncharacterized protein n=1 Tax=Mycena maculata TaxID=230809 RepID=A0AAD7IHU3_9AGAR|nr:hypothetical protein DFH07DRAFT_50688 [Mycena maculata]